MATPPLDYLAGFGNEHQSEALTGALPVGQFSPQKLKYGLFAEQFSTTAFTAPRASNRRTWFYRIRPSATQGKYQAIDNGLLKTAPDNSCIVTPERLRWDPIDFPTEPTDFIAGLSTIALNGAADTQTGMAIHWYSANQSMADRYFCNADGELLLVPQEGNLLLNTECGKLDVHTGEIALIPRGLKFSVTLLDGNARGYVGENYGAPLTLPERGPVGANGFANNRDFLYPVAAYDDSDKACELVTKFGGNLFCSELDHSPLDVVAWVGNSAPYKYDLSLFNVINTVSFDHPDPSIFTVLTSQSDTPGIANLDFVIFPPRWMVAEHTFRPPYFHRNVMSEFMGLIKGVYDAREKGFSPGGASIHNCMSPHGPEAGVFEKASATDLTPERYENSLAFMFESRYVMQPTQFAMESPWLQTDYINCWNGIKKHFRG